MSAVGSEQQAGSRPSGARPVFLLVDTLEPHGAQHCVLAIARGLQAANIPVRVIALRLGGALADTFTREGIEWMVLGQVRRAGGVAVLWELIRCFRVHRPGLVHTNLYVAGLFGRLAALLVRTPVIVHTQHHPLDEDSFVRRVLETVLDHRTTRLVAISDTVAEQVKRAHRLPAHRVTRIYNGAETSVFEPIAPLSADRPGTRIAVVGRLEPEKGHATLFQALPTIRDSVPDVTIEVSGTGALETSLRTLTNTLGIAGHVTFHGEILNTQDAYAQSDVVAVPSRLEGFGLVAAEAMAAARPVVASRVGGLPEIITDGETGVLVPPDDPAALAEALLALLTNPTRARTMGLAARQRALDLFSAERMSHEYRELFRDLLARHGLAWDERNAAAS